MKIENVSVEQKLKKFTDYWNPRIIGELNGQFVKVVKFSGEFIWHKHDNEDEMFFVIKGNFRMELHDKSIDLITGDFLIIPKGIEHKPVSEEEVHVMVIEPKTTLNTGDKLTKLTQSKLDRI